MSRTFILLTLCAFACAKYKFVSYKPQLEDTEYPENITTLKTLKEFVRLVEKHQLNVSLILSSGKNYEDDTTKEVVALTLQLPVNQGSITKTTLTRESLDKLAKVANAEKLTVAGTKAVNNHLTVITNNRRGLPINREYKIFTGIKNGRTGFVFDEENYVAQYTDIVPQPDRKNLTTRVLHGDVNVEVLEKSSDLTDDDLTLIKQAVIDGVFTFDEEDIPRGIIAILDKTLPDQSWDVAEVSETHNYVDSDKFALLELVQSKYLVYSI